MTTAAKHVADILAPEWILTPCPSAADEDAEWLDINAQNLAHVPPTLTRDQVAELLAHHGETLEQMENELEANPLDSFRAVAILAWLGY